MPWVPSNGAAPGLQDLVAGGVEFVPCSLPEARSWIDTGKLWSSRSFPAVPGQLMPLILLCGIVVMLVAGVAAFFMEGWGFPAAPTILGVVLGTMLEEQFFTSLIKADGDVAAFFARPIAATLGVPTLTIWLWPLARKLGRRPAPGVRAGA